MLIDSKGVPWSQIYITKNEEVYDEIHGKFFFFYINKKPLCVSNYPIQFEIITSNKRISKV